MKTIKTDTLLTVREVARQLKADENTVYYWIQNRLITYIELPMNTRRPAYRIWQSTIDDLTQNTIVARA